MYDQRGQEVAGPAQAVGAVEESETPEAAREQSTEVCAEVPADLQALIEACRAGDVSEILELSVETPGAVDVLLKQGTLDLGGEEVEVAQLYPEAAFWPQLLDQLEQSAATLSAQDRLNLGQLAQAMPAEERRAILERVFGVPLQDIAGAERLDAEALANLAAEAARLPAPEVEEEEVEEEAEAQAPAPLRGRSLSTQASLARIGLAPRGPEEAQEEELEGPAEALTAALRHEIGQELYFKQEGASSDRLREDAGWRIVSPEEFVLACEPQAQDTAEAVAVLEERFGEGRDPEVMEDKGDPDMESGWWTQVEALQDRFPNLVGALQIARYGKHLQRKAVRGGFAHASFSSGALSIISPDLYQRLGRWSNPNAMISDKEWAAELYAAFSGGGLPPDLLGQAERNYLEGLKRQYPNP